jgi:hypothetical protein
VGFFSPGSSSVFLREGYAEYITPCRALVVVLITSFLSSARGLEFLLFDGGTGALLQSQWEALGLCALQGWGESGRGEAVPCTSRVAYCHSVEELGFQLLDRRDVTLLQGGAG